MRRRLAPVTAPAPNIWPPLLRCGGVDSWHANGPFLKTVVEELGWPIIASLKQERYESHQETLALTRGQQPTLGGGTGRARSADWGRALGAFHRRLSRSGSGRARAGTLD
jgi:hypothetical protein